MRWNRGDLKRKGGRDDTPFAQPFPLVRAAKASLICHKTEVEEKLPGSS